MIRLSKRLTCVAKEIGTVDSFADVGTDHGQLIVYVLDKGIAKRAYAIDISENSLSKARQNVEKYGLSDRVTFYCGDGLKPLPDQPDVAVIAGMGGNETVKILTEGILPDKIVSVPHQDAHLVRRFFIENGYGMTADYVVEDKKYYAIIVAEKGKGDTDYSEEDIFLGKNNPPSDDFAKRNEKRLAEIKRILKDQNVAVGSLQPELQKEYGIFEKWSELHKS